MSEHSDHFEEELRRALRAGGAEATRPVATDRAELLERVHRGAARRRTRRRAGAAIASAALVGAVVVVAIPMLNPAGPGDDTADRTHQIHPIHPIATRPNARDGHSGRGRRLQLAESASVRHRPPLPAPGQTVPTVSSLQVRSVTGSGSDQFRLSGWGSCGGRLCNVLGSTTDGGDTFVYRVLPGNPDIPDTIVRFSGSHNSDVGWMTDGRKTFRTVDGGKDWTRVGQPADVRLAGLEAWGTEVWAVGRPSTDADKVDVLHGTRYSTSLEPVNESNGLALDQAVTTGAAGFGIMTDGTRGFLHTGDGGAGWNKSEVGCQPVDSSASAGAVWALCDGRHPELVRSTDQGASWQEPQPLGLNLSGGSPQVAAVDDQTAFVADHSGGWVVEAGSAPVAADGLDGGEYSYVGFTTPEAGFVLRIDGVLLRTDDGGHTWHIVDLS